MTVYLWMNVSSDSGYSRLIQWDSWADFEQCTKMKNTVTDKISRDKAPKHEQLT